MSVSVLSISESGPIFRSTAAAGGDPNPTRMSGSQNLKRPWEREHSPPRSSQSSFQQQHQQHAQSQQQHDVRYHPAQYDPSPRGPMPPHQYAAPLSRQPSSGPYTYPESQIGPVPPREVQHKRSRIDSEPSSAMHSPVLDRSIGKTSPGHAGHMPPRLPAMGQSAGPPRSIDKPNPAPGTISPQSGYYHSHGQAAAHSTVLPSPGSVTSSAGGSNPAQPPLPLMASSLLSPVSPSTTHLQNLQHELSTKSLAYSNLAGEHERLLAAYSRLQTRLAALDRKSKTADGELTMLQEERISLQERVDGLEKEVDELRSAKESETDQHTRESEQWRRIIDLSGMVQKRHTEEGEVWKSEKEGLLRRVEGLEVELRRVRLGTGIVANGNLSEGADAVGDAGVGSSTDGMASCSTDLGLTDTLRGEVASLRMQSEQARKQLEVYRSRMTELRELLSKADGLTSIDREDPK